MSAAQSSATRLIQPALRKAYMTIMKNDLRVLKFGGSSLATPEHIQKVARQIAAMKQPGQGMVIVASAMGGTTSKLMGMANDLSDNPSVRELDKLLSTGEHVSTALLCMALQEQGHDAISLSGAQCGIRTSDDHYNARVESVDTRRLRRELSAGRIVVSAGFQGHNAAGEVTTLGLGGSDTTAVVLAAALDARRCEICSDVDGVYSADPRVVEHASRIDEISYDEMVEMARHGASVLNPRAVKYARDQGVEIYSRSTFHPDRPGTLIHEIEADKPRVVGIAGHDELLSLSVEADTNRSTEETETLLQDAFEVHDLLVDHTDPDTGRRDILIPADQLPDMDSFGDAVKRRFGDRVTVSDRRSSVSAIGLGVGDSAHVQTNTRRSSEEAGVSLHDDYTAKHAFTCIVRPEQASMLMNILHRELDCPAEAAA